ncbi:hypothetical protein ACOME3_001485 [Neoechinorhynchus agilis]
MGDQIVIKSNQVHISVKLNCKDGRYDKHFVLYGIIDQTKSYAEASRNKLEIKLMKLHPTGSWPKLEK